MLALFPDQTPSYQTAKGAVQPQCAAKRSGLFGSLFGLFTIPAPAYRGTHPGSQTNSSLWDSLFPTTPQYQTRSAIVVREQEETDSDDDAGGSTTNVHVTVKHGSEE